tara:strand:+ start:43 stop:297 length:255 start_codon:yes stop_codon:yes gene_type:complete
MSKNVTKLFKKNMKAREKRMGLMKRRMMNMKSTAARTSEDYKLATGFLFRELESNIIELLEIGVSRREVIERIASSYDEAIRER